MPTSRLSPGDTLQGFYVLDADVLLRGLWTAPAFQSSPKALVTATRRAPTNMQLLVGVAGGYLAWLKSLGTTVDCDLLAPAETEDEACQAGVTSLRAM